MYFKHILIQAYDLVWLPELVHIPKLWSSNWVKLNIKGKSKAAAKAWKTPQISSCILANNKMHQIIYAFLSFRVFKFPVILSNTTFQSKSPSVAAIFSCCIFWNLILTITGVAVILLSPWLQKSIAYRGNDYPFFI